MAMDESYRNLTKKNKEFIKFMSKAIKEFSKTEDGKLASKMNPTQQITGLMKWLYMEGRIK